MNEERHEELAALYALGALPGEEARAFETELAGNPELSALVRDFQSAAAVLAHGAPRVEPPANLEGQLIAQIHAESAAALTGRRDRRWLAWAAAAALFAGLAALLGLERQRLEREVVALRGKEAEAANLGLDRARLEREIAALRAREAQAAAQAAQFSTEREQFAAERVLLTAERARLEIELATLRKKDALAALAIRTLTAQVAEARQTLAAVVWSQEEQRGILTVEKLRPPGPAQDYQLWVIDDAAPAPISAGLIAVDAQGRARSTFQSSAPVGSADKFAISREKKGGGTKPEGPIVLLSL